MSHMLVQGNVARTKKLGVVAGKGGRGSELRLDFEVPLLHSMQKTNCVIFLGTIDKDEDDIALIIGIVVGVALLVIFIALLMAYLVYRSKQSTKVESIRTTSPPYQRSFENKGVSSDHEMTPV